MSDSESQVTFKAPILEEVEALFPAYDVHSLIACGGMGAVYHATQRSLDRPVAIKLLPREFSTDEAFRTGFEAEAKAMAKLNHPNLIGVYDFGEVDGMLFIVMEYVAGNSLFEAAAGQPVEQSEAIRIINDVCHGLANAHDNGILHRDIKPANILLDANLTPKISDFGLARSLETQIQEGEQIFGTPGYTAPEVIEPPHSFDHRADIFSVGVMLYELLTGTLPTQYSPPASQVSSCNIRLDRVIQRAMNPDQNKRYDSATGLAADLQNIGSSSAKSLVTAGSSTGRPYVVPKYKKKSSGGLGTTLMLLLILGGGGYAYYHFKMKPADTVGPKPAENIINQDPTVAPSATPTPAPKSNVTGFLERATAVVAGRLKNAISQHAQNSEMIYTTFISKTKDTINALPESDSIVANELFTKKQTVWNNRIPVQLPEAIQEFEKIGEIHAVLLPTQIKENEKLSAKIAEESEFYVDVIQKRIEKIQGTDDQLAIDLLQEEINFVKNDPAYFPSKFIETTPAPVGDTEGIQ